MTVDDLRLIRARERQGTDVLAVRDRRALLAYVDELTEGHEAHGETPCAACPDAHAEDERRNTIARRAVTS